MEWVSGNAVRGPQLQSAYGLLPLRPPHRARVAFGIWVR